jgi:hypothetical protein
MQWEICTEHQVREHGCVVVKNPVDFIHISDAIIVLSMEGETHEGAKFRDTYCVKAAPTRNRKKHEGMV